MARAALDPAAGDKELTDSLVALMPPAGRRPSPSSGKASIRDEEEGRRIGERLSGGRWRRTGGWASGGGGSVGR
uniref:Uncharacterized protein n=1 Tax=Oryza glumipatula TaxID=40148 RepID=A0A0E0BHP9_9ORYZ